MGIRRAFIFILSSVIFVAACSPAEPPSAVAAQAAETITLGGSGAGYVAVRLVANAYTQAHPGVRFDFTASSSANSGLNSLRTGGIDVAVLARAPTLEQIQANELARYTVVARDAVAVVVNPSVGLVDISTSQLRDLYAGKIKTWHELGVAGDEVTLLDRPEDETAKITMRLILGSDLVIHSSAVQLSKEPDMVKAVEKTAGAVGFFSAALLVATPSTGRVVRIDGITPDVAAIRAGTYPAVRTITIAVNTSAADRSPLAGFLAYLGSREAADLLSAAGFAPLP